ncbi:unnamed protein product [Boreogadus saida]
MGGDRRLPADLSLPPSPPHNRLPGDPLRALPPSLSPPPWDQQVKKPPRPERCSLAQGSFFFFNAMKALKHVSAVTETRPHLFNALALSKSGPQCYVCSDKV